jgi:hypothetical protein
MNDFNASVIIDSFLDCYRCDNERGVTNDELADIIVTYLSAQNTELEKNFKLLKDIESLDDDWDTEGAKAVDTDIINVVRKELPFLLFQPDIFPTPDGTIQLEWADKDLNHLNIELINKTQMTITEMRDHNKFVSINTYLIDAYILNSKLREFFKSQFEPF